MDFSFHSLDIVKDTIKDTAEVVVKVGTKVDTKGIVKSIIKGIAKYYHILEAGYFILAHRLDFTKDNFPMDFNYFTL